ncbi:MAG: hypothetical protein ABL888_09685 [Pirellulaceae bacterium]
MKLKVLCVFAVIWLQCMCNFAETLIVKISVAGPDGNPVVGADVSTLWEADNGQMTPTHPFAVVTNSKGNAEFRIEDWGQPRPLLILSADRALGRVVGISKKDDGTELKITLTRTVKVKGKLFCEDLNLSPLFPYNVVTADGFRNPMVNCSTSNATFEFALPIGKYTLKSYGLNVTPTKTVVDLNEEEPVLDLGTINLPATPIAKLIGKPAPDLFVSEVRGIEKSFKLSDYRGRWVYLEFWGFW